MDNDISYDFLDDEDLSLTAKNFLLLILLGTIEYGTPELNDICEMAIEELYDMGYVKINKKENNYLFVSKNIYK